ncbi:MAG: YkgJ family cysteine cluster protein [Syntrophobacteraceae bacterium]
MDMEIRETAPENIQEKLQPIGPEGFRFACHPGVPCFTECCRDLNLLLTPYDVLRLKNRLGLPAGEFLDRFADCRFEENRNLPKMYLQMSENERRTCPFVTPKGCSVYEDRPSACRIYPVARASRVHRVHGTVLENYFILREDHCGGFEEERRWTTGEWLHDQGLEAYYESNDLWMEILTHPALRNAALSPRQQQVFYMGSYNCDKFREMVFASRFLSAFDIPEDEAEKIRTDESALLKLAFKWIKFSLLGEPALKPRQG